MMMIVEKSVECELAREAEILGESLSQCHFVHLKREDIIVDRIISFIIFYAEDACYVIAVVLYTFF
jgi:hypothetical protein